MASYAAVRELIGSIDHTIRLIKQLRGYEIELFELDRLSNLLNDNLDQIGKIWPDHPYRELLTVIPRRRYGVPDINEHRRKLTALKGVALPTKDHAIEMAFAAARAPPAAPAPPPPVASGAAGAAAAPTTLLAGVSANSPGTVTTLASTTHRRQVYVGRLCAFSPSGEASYDIPTGIAILVQAGQLISSIFEFEKILQPIPAVAAAASAAAAAPAPAAPAAGPNPTTHPLDYIYASFCNPHTSLEPGVPVIESYAVVDVEQYDVYVHKIIGACILARTSTHWAIWSVVGDPYRIKAHTFHHMFNAIKRTIVELGGPRSVKLIASDAPVPFVTFSDRLTLYATEGFETTLPFPPLSGVAPNGQWFSDVPVEHLSKAACYNISETGGRLVMSYNPMKASPEKELTLPASIPMRRGPLDIVFSWGHSNYLRAATTHRMAPVNTGNVRVIVTTVPSSSVLGIYALAFMNMLSELLKYVPFSMLLKIFPGIRVSPSTPLVIAHEGHITQEFSKELYGGILIKLPSTIFTGPEYGPLPYNVSNIFSIYVYDVNTYIPDMGVGYQDSNPVRQATFGMYRVDPSKPYVQDDEIIDESTMKLFGKSDRIEGDLGLPGSTTTLGKMIEALQTPESHTPRVLLHSLCGAIEGDGVYREAATTAITKRLEELHPKAVVLNSKEELAPFLFQLAGAISRLAQQVATVASHKNIATVMRASAAKGGHRTQRKRR